MSVQVGWARWDGDEFYDFRYASPEDRKFDGLLKQDGFVKVYADLSDIDPATERVYGN